MQDPETPAPLSSNPFASIESALEFLSFFDVAISETQADIEADLASADDNTRRQDALRLAIFKLDRLRFHIGHSRRMVNDLRTIRRLLHQERQSTKPLVRATEA